VPRSRGIPLSQLTFTENSVSDPDWIRIQSGQLIRIRIQEVKKTHKNREKKLRNFIFGSAGWSLFRAESFLFRLDVLYGSLGIGKL
jgi:hypothetical protein